ncbi:MAG TPA: sigma-70 family RNA polymerase sigma factor [Anaerolineales bacterium]|nr:sigma-70 family RNA polymerase sigma factor [Anaerolineales bacterium]
METNDKAPSGQLRDEILVARVASGDKTALETLYDQHAGTVLGISFRIVGDRAASEEILQETFWRVWQNAVAYRSERGSFTSWLFRIARNLAIDTCRRRKVRPQAVLEWVDNEPILDQLPDPDMDVAEKVQANLKGKQVRNALAQLPGEQRQVIELAYFYGMTRQEIAAATGEALGTVHTRARLGLQKLREELERVEFER